MKPLRPRYSKIERVVLNLLSTHQIRRPAVPIEDFVKGSGIQLKYGDLGDVSGLLVRFGSEATIGVNSDQNKGRQRFTIAHEFGHFLLHDEISQHLDRDFKVKYRSAESSQATDVEEIEANFFAASLLMPKPFLDEDQAIKALDNDAAVKELSDHYKVSRHAMSLRLANVYRVYTPY